MAPSFSLALLLLALLQLVLSAPYNGAEVSPSGEDVHATWGPYSWQTLEAGKAESLRSGKPLLLLIWKTWCGACKSLRPKFAASSDIAAEAPGFVMVNVVDDEEPSDALYKPEGAGYSALRLLF